MKPVSRTARLALVLALVCAAAALLAGPGYRLALWPLRAAFNALGAAAIGAAVAGILGMIALAFTRKKAPRRGRWLAVLAVVTGVATFALPATMLIRARTLPPIHDITTDADNPPRFVAALAARAGAANGADYPGADVASQQRAAYPDIAPLELPAPPKVVFERAQDVVRDMRWQVIAAEPGEGRIEATDTTPFFGFADDVVIRITAQGAGSRVDVRSVSRVGKSDVGTNAHRIAVFLDRLKAVSR